MRLLLVDGHYYAYRSFFAIQAKLTNPDGQPTNAVLGFVKAVRKMLQDLRPDRAAVIWDQGLPQRRLALQPAYKQTRVEMPEDMRPQIATIQGIVPLMGLASIGVPDTEADDLIAAYALQAVAAGGEAVLATNDKDLFQIVGPGISVYTTAKAEAGNNGFALLSKDHVLNKWGVRPAQIRDVLALLGDTVDNIPGVPGFGPKTAAKWIAAFGSLESLLQNLDQVGNERLRAALDASRAQALENLQMVTLETDLPLPVPLESLGIRPRYPALIEALRRCGFRSLLSEVEKEAAAAARREQGELF